MQELSAFSLPFELAGNSQGHIVAKGQTGTFDIFEGNGGNLTGEVFGSPVVGVFNNLTGKVSFILLKNETQCIYISILYRLYRRPRR